MNKRPISTMERLRLNMQLMDYQLMEHYGWTLREVHGLSMNEVKQAVSWATAMNRPEPESTTGEVVYLGYDNIPPIGGNIDGR